MVSHLFFDQLVLIALVWLFVMLLYAWLSELARHPSPAAPIAPRRKRSTEPKAFAGLTHQPYCALCEGEAIHPKPPSPLPPDPMPPTHRRPRTVETTAHFCPHTNCAYRGWLGRGNLRANGHPGGGPWRQFYCMSCNGYFLETHGTIFHGKRVAAELLIRVLACLAEGLGIRATARVFGVDPNTVLGWLGEAAEQLQACVPCMLSCSGVKVPCPGIRGAEGQGKRKSVTARWGLKEAWNEGAGRGTRTGYEVWHSRDERARDREVLHPQLGWAL